MNPSSPEFVDETPRRARRAAQEVEAEERLGHHWVTVLATARPLPRDFNDNRGALPVWVEVNADWRQSGAAFDLQQPLARAVRLVVVGVPTRTHAARLKAELDTALCGRERAGEATELRHRFRNAIDLGPPETWLWTLLQDALVACELSLRGFEIISRAEHDAAVAAEVARRGRKGR